MEIFIINFIRSHRIVFLYFPITTGNLMTKKKKNKQKKSFITK